MGDFKEDLQFTQRALEIRIKLFGEEHQSTADCYYSLGITQHKMGDFKEDLQFTQRALEKRIKLFGEEHQSTADCYYDFLTKTSEQHKGRLLVVVSFFVYFRRVSSLTETSSGNEYN